MPCCVMVSVTRGVATLERAHFVHDDNFIYSHARHNDLSEKHRQALFEAADYAQRLAEGRLCRWQSNF